MMMANMLKNIQKNNIQNENSLLKFIFVISS